MLSVASAITEYIFTVPLFTLTAKLYTSSQLLSTWTRIPAVVDAIGNHAKGGAVGQGAEIISHHAANRRSSTRDGTQNGAARKETTIVVQSYHAADIVGAGDGTRHGAVLHLSRIDPRYTADIIGIRGIDHHIFQFQILYDAVIGAEHTHFLFVAVYRQAGDCVSVSVESDPQFSVIGYNILLRVTGVKLLSPSGTCGSVMSAPRTHFTCGVVANVSAQDTSPSYI